MWKTIRPFVLIVSITLNVALVGTWAFYALPAHLGGRHGASSQKQHEGGCPLQRKLGVTGEQWEKIEPEVRRFQREVRERRQNMQKLWDEMVGILQAPEVDRERMKAQQEKILRGHRQMQDLVLDHILTQKRNLTPGQKEKLFDLLRNRMGNHATGSNPGLRGALQNMDEKETGKWN